MTSCPHCYTDSETLSWQSEQIESLQEEVRRLKEIFIPPPLSEDLFGIKLTPSEAQVLSLLLSRDSVSRDALWSVCRHTKEEPYIKGLAVMISRLRKKVAPLGIVISSIFDTGYFIPKESRHRFAPGGGHDIICGPTGQSAAQPTG